MATQPRFTSKILRDFLATSQGKSYAVAGVTTLLVLILFLFGMFPAISSILLQVTENDYRRTAIALIEDKRKVLRDLISQESDKRAVTVALNTYLPSFFDQKYTLTKFAEYAKETGNEIVSVTYNPLDPMRSLQQTYGVTLPLLDAYNVQIGLEGTTSGLQEFLALIEDSKRLANVLDVSVFSQEADDSITGASFRMEVQLEVFYWNLDKPAQSQGSAASAPLPISDTSE